MTETSTTGFPEVPGYVLHEQIGKGGASAVYLAEPIDGPGPVAVRFLPQHSGIEQFLRGGAIHSQMRHKNIGSLLDFGECPGGAYQAVEYLPGGDLHKRLTGGLHIQTLLKVVKDIARALDDVHEAGYVHGDVKPENVLFRANGTAVLCDFDLAVENGEPTGNASKMTVRGTPEFMSPEQAAGRPLDGRSDLYSLGVMLYRLLTGNLPYRAESAVSIGIKHLQDPVPRLPSYLSAFQNVIDRALAKRPDQRFQTGAAMVAAIDGVRGTDTVPQLTVKTRPISTAEIMAVGGDLLSTPLDQVRQERRSALMRRRRRLRNTALAAVVLIGLGAGGYYAYETGIVAPERLLSRLGIGENPQVAAAWSEAQSLRQDPNQGLSSIAAGYRRVLALDPGHEQARAEVDTLASDWRESISDALLAGNLELAETRLHEASEVFPNDVEWVQLNVSLQNRQRAERIMVSTQGLLTSHGLSDLPSATAAIQAYQEVLRLAPEHAAAVHALNELSVHYAGMATAAAIDGEVSQAISLLERATLADASLAQLDEVRTLISQATTAQQAIEELLQQARFYRADNQLITPAGENAAELYHRVLSTDPDNVFAAQGLDEVSAQITASANMLLSAGDLPSVELLVNQAAAVALNAEVINDLRSRIDAEISRQQSIAANLQTAENLMALGYLTAPADNHAVAYLREIQQLDPGNERATALLQQCAERLAAVAVEAHEFGLTETARQYLDLALTITPEVEPWVILRDSWNRT